MYDEVDEHQYKAIVKGRLQRDDFIEDDDGAGYADNGEDFQDDAFIQEESDSDHKSEWFILKWSLLYPNTIVFTRQEEVQNLQG